MTYGVRLTHRVPAVLLACRDPLKHSALRVLSPALRASLAEPLRTLAIGEVLRTLPADGTPAQATFTKRFGTVDAIQQASLTPDQHVGATHLRLRFATYSVPTVMFNIDQCRPLSDGTPVLPAGRTAISTDYGGQEVTLALDEHSTLMQLLPPITGTTGPAHRNAVRSQRDLTLNATPFQALELSAEMTLPFRSQDRAWERMTPDWLDGTPTGRYDRGMLCTFAGIVLLYVDIIGSAHFHVPQVISFVVAAAAVLIAASGLVQNSGTRSSMRERAERLVNERTGLLGEAVVNTECERQELARRNAQSRHDAQSRHNAQSRHDAVVYTHRTDATEHPVLPRVFHGGTYCMIAFAAFVTSLFALRFHARRPHTHRS